MSTEQLSNMAHILKEVNYGTNLMADFVFLTYLIKKASKNGNAV